MPFCQKCGKPLAEGAQFCANCGTPVPAARQEMYRNTPSYDPNPGTNYVPLDRAPANNVNTYSQAGNRYSMGSVECHYHEGVPAVTYCARCGRPLCQDCADSYGVSSGEYEGRTLCYDCTQQMVAENVQLLKENKKEILKTFITTLIGVVIGGIIGAVIGAESGAAAGFVGFLFGALIGGCFWTYITGIFWRTAAAISASGLLIGLIVGLLVGSVIEGVLAIYRTIRTIVECIIYLKRTQGFIESDSQSLRMMADYMEFTQVRNRNPGLDVDALIARNPELADNAIAQMARTQTEEQIEAGMREQVASVNGNSEVLHQFADSSKNNKPGSKK